MPLRAQLPVFDPPEGAYAEQMTVTISCATAGAIIRYTLDGSEPVLLSPIYFGPIELTHSGPVRAKAYKLGMVESLTATASYD
jgi:chitinase